MHMGKQLACQLFLIFSPQKDGGSFTGACAKCIHLVHSQFENEFLEFCTEFVHLAHHFMAHVQFDDGWRLIIQRSLPQSRSPSPSEAREGLGGCKSLTMTYFHTGTRTIIGAKSFHCPVRDGKEWYRLAMVIRHNWVPGSHWLNDCQANS